MTREIRINAFGMNCVAHCSPGLWTHPRDNSARYKDLDYWTDLARILERGLFDGLFLADVLGVYDIYGGNVESAVQNAIQIPVNDPLLLVPAMAAVTEHLGFGITCTLTYEPPFTFARRMSTLDHLTKGRIGWNIVTGYLDSAAKGLGERGQKGHDTRYEIAEEYMEVVYKLWEGSWEDGAVLRDRERRIFTDPEKVHRIRHEGAHFRLDAIHLSEPSPQRTPLLYQAGTSSKGRDFAARHAECVFMTGPSKPMIAARVKDIRQRALRYGRDPAEILVFLQIAVVVDKTETLARAKYDEYLSYSSPQGVLTLIAGFTGIDFSAYGLDDPIRYVKNDAIHSAVEGLTVEDPDKVWTVGELAQYAAIGGIAPVVIGTPTQVADELEQWMNATDIDGFNLSYAVTPESFIEFIELVVPELQRRGIFKREYREGTLREKLYGEGRARLSVPHPGALHRQPAAAAAAPVIPRHGPIAQGGDSISGGNSL